MWPIQVTSQQLLLQGGLRLPWRTLQTVWFSFRTGRLCPLRQDKVLMLALVLQSIWTLIIECLVTGESSRLDSSSQFVLPHFFPSAPSQSWLVTQSFSRSFHPNILRFRNSQQPFLLTRLLPNQWERLRPELERENGKRVSKRTEQVRDGDRRRGAWGERERETRVVCPTWVSVFIHATAHTQQFKHSFKKFFFYLRRYCLGMFLATMGWSKFSCTFFHMLL